jgi:acyl transferase domain-containing protein
VAVDWAAVLGGRRVDLPTYAFQRQRFWPKVESRRPEVTARDNELWAAVQQGDVTALAGLLGLGDRLDDRVPLGELLASLAAWRQETPADGAPAGGPLPWVVQLTGLTRGQQRERIHVMVREGIAELLGYETPNLVPADADVFEIGMTSMLAVQLRESITERTGVNLPEGFIYDFYSPAAIADFLFSELSPSLPDGDSTAV